MPTRSVRSCLALFAPLLAGCHGLAWHDDPVAGRLHLTAGDVPVLGYCYGDQLPAGVDPSRLRSSYIHPIHGLDGEVLTEDFPKDHEHHRGLSLMWPVMRVGDVPCDLWTIRDIRSVFRKRLYASAGFDGARLGIHNVWQMPGRGVVADEELHLRVHRATAIGRVLEVRYVLTARTAPITLRGQTTQNKGYGGLVLRTLHDSKRRETVITTNKGPQRGDSLRQRFTWADISARYPGGRGMSGVAVIPTSGHPDYPPTWMLRHYGVLNPSWPGQGEFVLRPGVPLELRYWIYVHRGDATAGKVKEVAAGR